MIGAGSTYEAFQLTFKRRWTGGLQTLVSFTAAKSLANTSGNETWTAPGSSAYQDYNNLAAEKSLDGTDIPKSLVVSYIYELPFGRGKHFGSKISKPLNATAGGWQVSGISTFKSGFPLAFGLTTNTTNSFGGGQRPNVVGSPMAQNPTPAMWLNPSAFSEPAPFTFGDESRYDPHARAPGLNNWDFMCSKWFTYRERFRTQLRFEFFNLANHPIFYAPDTTFGDPAFGTITKTYPARNIQVALKLYW
jgi:hypothetical protein